MIQGNIVQDSKWDRASLEPSFKVYVEGSRAAVRERADLIIWPETAAPFLFQRTEFYPAGMQRDRTYRRRLLQLARTLHRPLLFGAPSLRFARELTLRNRAYLVRADGQLGGYYDKMRLVPIAEYVPLRPVLGHFVRRLVQTVGGLDVAAGNRRTIFDIGGVRLAVLICYESLFPDLSRKAVAAGANVLVNLSNDASFGRSAEPYQVLAMSVFRAVENRTPMVRVTNSGISALVTPLGEVAAATPLFTRTVEVENVAWRQLRTVYTTAGDLFAELCLALSVASVAVSFLIRHLTAVRSR
jgi:apolipoprotein N-acyltransferase